MVHYGVLDLLSICQHRGDDAAFIVFYVRLFARPVFARLAKVSVLWHDDLRTNIHFCFISPVTLPATFRVTDDKKGIFRNRDRNTVIANWHETTITGPALVLARC